MSWKLVNSFDMQMESIMIKVHGNVRKRTKKSIGGLPHNKKCIVRKYELLNDTLFLMSNLEGLGIFVNLFVGSLLFWITVKILVEVIQFPVQVSGFSLGRFIGFL